MAETDAPEQQVQQNQQDSEGISISWTGPEFAAHPKNGKWYLSLTGGALLVAILVLLLTKDKISAAVVVFGALLFGVYAGREPRNLDYHVSERGITIGQKYYDFQNFRSFALVSDEGASSIILLPLKRFSPPLSVHYAPQEEDRIIKVLSDRLPFDPDHNDPVDNLMRRIHF